MIYYKGKGAQPDYANAYPLFLKSANSDYPKAQYYVGIMHYYGYGVNRNYFNAFEWFYHASNQMFQWHNII